jgi:hypothetical protein
METIIVFIDDADYAVQMLQPMLPATNHTPTRWVLVGCAPRITRRVSKWVTKGARHNWQLAWADKVFTHVLPSLQQPGRASDEIITQLAPSRQTLCDLTQSLTQQYGSSRVLDARQPKLGHELQPVTTGQKQERQQMTGYAAALAGAGVLAGFD